MPGINQERKGSGALDRYAGVIEKHVHSLKWMREELLEMDSLAGPVMGISSWDDAVVIGFGGKKLVASVDGPYAKRLVMKSALIHAATDVAVKGGRPLFALDTLNGSEADIREMIGSLKKQSLAMGIPLLGGNTLADAGAEPRCSLTVVGELLLEEPIRDCTAKKGDVVALMGEPIWGAQDERIEKARKLFSAWFAILGEGIKIDAAKDVTKGGLVCALYEIAEKSRVSFELEGDIAFSMTRNLDNFLVCAPEESLRRMEGICAKAGCPVVRVGSIL